MRLPSGIWYWTVVDENYAVVPDADAFLRHVRFGRDQEELTTRTYAGHVALFLRWCARTGRDWRVAAEEFVLFLVWLKFGSKEATGVDRPAGHGLVLAGPGAEPARQLARIQNVVTGVRQFLLHGVGGSRAPVMTSTCERSGMVVCVVPMSRWSGYHIWRTWESAPGGRRCRGHGRSCGSPARPPGTPGQAAVRSSSGIGTAVRRGTAFVIAVR
ncbi:hypothetical protein ACIOHC_43700 [Streptomyces sp. NPDC088252]|uniref:hypothetical protein n=1 Tax=unclassified Streptomyces TaxID=2593676 RepID=UPI003447D09C